MSRGAVGSLLVLEPGIAGAVDERYFALEAGRRASRAGSAARGAPRAGQEHAQFEQTHHANHDPKEEQRAGPPREVIAEHGEISVSGWAAPALLSTPTIARSR
jgi:hypothetical protein